MKENNSEYQRRLLANRWKDTTPSFSDAVASSFEREHYTRIDNESRTYTSAVTRLLELLAAAERATDF